MTFFHSDLRSRIAQIKTLVDECKSGKSTKNDYALNSALYSLRCFLGESKFAKVMSGELPISDLL